MRLKFRVTVADAGLQHIKRLEDGKLFVNGDVIDLDDETVNIKALLDAGAISPLDVPKTATKAADSPPTDTGNEAPGEA